MKCRIFQQIPGILRRASRIVIVLLLIASSPLLSLVVFPVQPSVADPSKSPSGSLLQNTSQAAVSRDAYYKTDEVVLGPRAPRLNDEDYPRLGLSPLLGESRLIIWMLAQQHLYWGGFVLGVLALITVLEVGGLMVRSREIAQRYDACAYEMLRLIMLSLSVAAILGGVLLFGLLSLYPDLMKYLTGVFRPVFVSYGLLLVVFGLAVYLYYSTWMRLDAKLSKWVHASLGILVNALGTLLLTLANAWSSFMVSPAGVDEWGRFLGNYWHVLHTATWNAFNVHRFFGNIVFGAAVMAAYAAYHAMTAKTKDEKAHYDWMSHVSILAMVFALITIPFGGYWLMREIYAYRQQMGITLLGGLLAWLGVVLVSLIGLLFLGINYYLWQRMDSVGGGERYRLYAKYVFFILAACLVVYVTPHTMVMTGKEFLQMGGQQHQVLGNFGVESAKQSAINIMMVITMWSFILWLLWRHQASKDMSPKVIRIMTGFFLAAIVNIIWLGIYGYYIPANVRVGLAVPMVATTFSIVILVVLTVFMLSKMKDGDLPFVWGHLSTRGQYMLFLLAFTVTWIMGLGGYRRSSVRLFWHVNEIMRDNSPRAFTHTIGFAANVITLNAIIFWCGLAFLIWLASTASAAGVRSGLIAESRL